MTLGPPPWERSYPPGLKADAEIATGTVGNLIEEAARTWDAKPAIDHRGRSISYADLDAEAARAARGYLGLGLAPGERVALYLPNTPFHPIAFLGAMKAGLVVVHISPLDADRVIAHKLADSGARVMVTTDFASMDARVHGFLQQGLLDMLIVGDERRWDEGHSDDGGKGEARPGTLAWAAFVAAGADAPLPAVGAGDLALLQYTGGTTGLPKAAMLTHANLTAAVSSYDLWSNAFGMTRRGRERVLLYLPLFHIYGLTAVLLRSLGDGHTLVLKTRFDPKDALDEIEAGATVMPGVPTMWIAMMAEPDFEKRDLSSLFFAASGGAPMPAELARKFTARTGLELLGGWGMTETSPAGTNLPKERPDKVGTIGIPLPGVSMRIVSLADPAKPLSPGETGEIAVRGLNVTAGYYNRPEENAAAFSDEWLLTGDIGSMDEDGFFTIVDRKKDMIISGGFNVYPQMIEQAIYEHEDVEEVLIIGIADAYRGEAAKAFVKLRSGAQALTLDALRAFLKSRLGPHEMPVALELRDALPRTPVGKLSKLELKQEERERAARTEGNPAHA